MIDEIRSLRLGDFEELSEESIPSDFDDELTDLKEVLPHLGPETKEFVIRERIRKVVRVYGEEGLTAEEVARLVGVSKATAKKHLDILCSLREVYSLKKDRKITLYFPNGKPLHTVGKVRFECPIPGKLGHPIFEITVNLGSGNQKFLHILEKKYTLLNGETPEGAILVPFDYLDKFIEALKQIRRKFEEVKGDGD